MPIEKLAKPIIDLNCHYCGERCFMPVSVLWWTDKLSTENMLRYMQRGVELAATCQQGHLMEVALLGLKA